MPLCLYARLRSFGLQSSVSATRLKLARFYSIVQEAWKHFVDDLGAQRRVLDRKRQLDAPVEISWHPLCARKEDPGWTCIYEIKNAVVFEKPPNDTDDANVFAQVRNFGTQTTDAADDEIDGYLCAGRFVKFFDRFLIDKRI